LRIGRKAHAAQLGAHDERLRGEIGPNWCHGHHLITSVEQALAGDHERIDAPCRDSNTVCIHCTMQAARILRHRVAQRGQAQIVRIKGVARLQRADRRIANELRRDLIAFAKPKGQDAFAANAGVGYFADFGFFQRFNNTSHAHTLRRFALLKTRRSLLFLAQSA
jgi:hypothetical protein